MTRPREERRRDYREPPSRYRPSEDRRPPSSRPSRRYPEEDYFYEEGTRYPEPRRERPRQVPRYDSRGRPMRPTSQRPYASRQYEDRAPLPRPRRQQIHPRYEERYPLKQAKRSTQRKLVSFVYNLFFYTLTIGIILSAVMFAFSEKSNAAILGYRFYQVLTNSMATQAESESSGFYAGDIVVVKMMDGSNVQVDDIVTFQIGEGDRYLTHRMIERLDELNGETGDYIVTKGDANNTADPPISADKVFGKVVFVIPKLGAFLAFVRENPWLCLVCVLSTFGFFLVLKAYFLQSDKQSSGPKGYSHL